MRRRTVLPLTCLLALAAIAIAQEPAGPAVSPGTAAADSLAAAAGDTTAARDPYAAMADSLKAAGNDPDLVDRHIAKLRKAGTLPAAAGLDTLSSAWFRDCTNRPEAGIKADVTKVSYFGSLANSVLAASGGKITDTYRWGWDTYRRQVKTVETRSALAAYDSGELLPFTLTLQASVDWANDLTTNTGGSTNQNKRETRRGGFSIGKSGVATGRVTHSIRAGGYVNDFRSINQQQRNDTNEGEVSAAVRSKLAIAEGLSCAARLYGIKRDGDSNLAGFASPSSTSGDTLGADAYYVRRVATGQITLSQSAFDRRYLDYRRNSNGLIDTTNLPEGASKVIRELEEQDAWSLRWDNILQLGWARVSSKFEHKFAKQQYDLSLVGRKDRSEDLMDLVVAVPAGRDSFAVAYKYQWNWDDQQFADATSSRGRQYLKSRDLAFDWFHTLSRDTELSGRYHAELTQDIAENQFNENDRDRLTQDLRLRLDSDWRRGFSTSLLAEYQVIDDVAIRNTRSVNNNTKRTYEVAPSYSVALRPGLQFSQVFRMYIQYQDYDFADLPASNKDDTYNKRGILGTTVRWSPSERLEAVVKHDFSQKYNGTRTSKDSAGNTFYRRDQDQAINRIELGLSWTAIAWTKDQTLKIQTATYRTKDEVTRFGTPSRVTSNYSGELWIGAVINRSLGPPGGAVNLNARVKRYLAYGPNVTDTSDDYWEADVLASWAF
ncbi:MAG TPA: hypothetical protein PLL30_11185 [Candidatus Krumholzibacteria bacterium]|nr:hypothetical protein [Candidatus Krumholzibacteria bacterium]HPD72329.1 hypothetical protein [Candidatus Krumholzibacteria bacterium]HRY40739.1 hypothetical protein [Candidatus Krumholzibacteria bacterium]